MRKSKEIVPQRDMLRHFVDSERTLKPCPEYNRWGSVSRVELNSIGKTMRAPSEEVLCHGCQQLKPISLQGQRFINDTVIHYTVCCDCCKQLDRKSAHTSDNTKQRLDFWETVIKQAEKAMNASGLHLQNSQPRRKKSALKHTVLMS